MDYLQNIKVYVVILGIAILVVGGVVWKHGSALEDGGVYKTAEKAVKDKADTAKAEKEALAKAQADQAKALQALAQSMLKLQQPSQPVPPAAAATPPQPAKAP